MNSVTAPSEYDCIVVGSGAGGCAAVYQLVKAGLRVALVEKGHTLPRDNSTLDSAKVVHQGIFKSTERWQDRQGLTFAPEEHFNLGGKTKWYGAALLRYGRHEFAADPSHQCLGWPFGYDELAPWYDQAESLLGVREFAAEPGLERIVASMNRNQWQMQPLPLALHASIRNNALEASRFDGFASTAGLKGDGETAFLSRLRGASNLTLLTGAEVTALIGAPQAPHRICGVRLHDGRELYAGKVLLAAGALHSPRLLQRYLAASGIADSILSADAIGRYLKLHLLTALVAVSTTRQTDLIRKTRLFLNPAMPHSSVQPLGFDGELIGTLIPPLVPRALATQIGTRAYGFFLQTEDSAHRDNHVRERTVAGVVQPVMDYDPDRSPAARREHTRLTADFRKALWRAGLISFAQRIGNAGTAHVSGTMIAGSDPASSVVAPDGQVHGMQSLYVVDGSILPRSSRVNPALTIYAWSLRVAHLIANRSEQNIVRVAPEVVS